LTRTRPLRVDCGQPTGGSINTTMEMPSSEWTMDKDLFASLPGGQTVIDWYGFCPHFHDGILERLELSGGNAVLAIRAFRMANEVDAAGYFVQDRHAVVTLQMCGVTGVKLEGDAGSIISALVIRRLPYTPDPSVWETCGGPVAGDIEIAFDTAVGLYGMIYAKDLRFELHPLAEAPTA
jgi:hypothetical protein